MMFHDFATQLSRSFTDELYEVFWEDFPDYKSQATVKRPG